MFSGQGASSMGACGAAGRRGWPGTSPDMTVGRRTSRHSFHPSRVGRRPMRNSRSDPQATNMAFIVPINARDRRIERLRPIDDGLPVRVRRDETHRQDSRSAKMLAAGFLSAEIDPRHRPTHRTPERLRYSRARRAPPQLLAQSPERDQLLRFLVPKRVVHAAQALPERQPADAPEFGIVAQHFA